MEDNKENDDNNNKNDNINDNGDGGDDGYVVLSKVRAGHKREFQFAQTQLAGSSLSRLRVRKRVDSPTQVKKTKKSIIIIGGADVEGGGEEEEDPPKSDVTSDDETGRKCVVVESEMRDDSVTDCEDEGGDVEDDDWCGGKLSACEDGTRRQRRRKVPGVLKELLETGLLEGLTVRYIRKKCPNNKELAGVIRGTGILCYCHDCKGNQVVTPNQFELHAGSGNKRPTDHLYLENGRSIRYVLNACRDVKLNCIVAAIRNAVSTSPENSFCLTCREPISESVGRMTLVCSSCAELEASRTPPSQAIGTGKRCIESVPAPRAQSSSSKSQGKITRKDLRLHKLVFKDDFLPDGTELGYYMQGKKRLSGYKKGSGIFCCCCDTVVSPSLFESHAGCASRRKPYDQIYTSNGASLHELSVNLSRACKFSTDENDDLCSICHLVGNLLCCDGCPRAFHIKCVFLPTIPKDKWYCRHCKDMLRKEKFAESNPNAIAAGRVPGVDPIEQITSRCIRIVKALDSQDGGCALCRIQDFCKSGFGPRTVIICDQCEKEYHVGCMKEHNMQDLKELPAGDWFCCSDCERINFALKQLIEQDEQQLPADLLDIVKKKLTENESNEDDLDIKWRVFSGKKSCLDEIRTLLSKAVSVFHEQFNPICYGELKQDLIPHMVYGRNLKETEFGGMYCAALTVNSTIVSAGVFRVFGKELAEIPLVATSKDCEGKGYFQCLYYCFERVLGDLDVKSIMLPAAEERMSLWMNRFGFSVMQKQELSELKRCYSLMHFEGTLMLCKRVPESRT